ncbi:hypothetical protein [Streptomyces hyaluromycini]|uniref:hypothetical protein n=1 Tax=Streptomyces hyaluromycini TaxID=1377993 RepID=UPI00142E823B|nr:hypothetical protein [Streptomyces hyaluromycini]
MTVRTAWLSPDGHGREDTRTNQAGALTPVTVTEQVDLVFAAGDAQYGRIDPAC